MKDVEQMTTNTFEDVIIAKTDWFALDKIPMGKGPLVKEMKAKLKVTGSGVYQLALKSDLPIDGYVHANIGYTGMGKDIFTRVTGIKNGRHNAGKMIKRQNLKHEDVLMRYLFTEPGNEALLENRIHNDTLHTAGYTFKWRDASGGNDGIATRVLVDIDKIENPADLVTIIRKAEERFGAMVLQYAKDGTMMDMARDYFTEDE